MGHYDRKAIVIRLVFTWPWDSFDCHPVAGVVSGEKAR
jgi:hypothetical protein